MSRDIPNDESEHTKKASKRSWEALTPQLSEWILDAISSMGFHQMTPVQASTIPLFMGNKDVVVEAVTGSGKTLSFLIPTIEKLLRMDEPPKKHHIGAIIISPTRELASQIFSVLESLLAFHPPSAAYIEHSKDDMDLDSDDEPRPPPPSTVANRIVAQLLLGGTTTPAQDISAFLARSPNLIVATPGRLLELLSSQHVHCTQSSFEMLVMDEADRLLDLGFSDTLRKILTRLPKQRRTGLFSASMSEAVDQLIRVGLRNPVKVAVRVRSASGKAEGKTPASLDLRYLALPPPHKLPAIMQLLSNLQPQPQKTVLYLSTCAAVDYFSRILPTLLPSPFTLVPLHGKQPPDQRTRNFTAFVTSTTPTLLLTTDVAARGLDIPLVDLVLQLDPPSDPKTFLHRCGRAGRAGRRGLAVVFLSTGREEDYISFLSLRGTPVAPLERPVISVTEAHAKDTTARIREVVLRDRALHDRAQRAFVSWVRSYSKHAASSIFSVRGVDWAAVGEAWGLLRLPRMPEAKGWSGDGTFGVRVDWEAYRYVDKVREKKRLEELKAWKEGGADGARGKGEGRAKDKEDGRKERAWTRQKDIKKTREERREKRVGKREKERKGKMTAEEREKDEEMERLVKEVRKRNEEAFRNGEVEAVDDNEWEGFSD